jgi:2-polyprenyl-6-methoxyphenol hydroxylase-like FAD-dependent oxidoreductase
MNEYDLIIVGAGPAGQSLAARLAQAPLRIALIDKESKATLAAPAYDGREIALTQTSIARLKQLGAWARLAEREVAPLTRAEVINGQSPYVLSFADQSGEDALGTLAPNSATRRQLRPSTRRARRCVSRTARFSTGKWSSLPIRAFP